MPEPHFTVQLLFPDVRLPARATAGSAGYDLYAYINDRPVKRSLNGDVYEHAPDPSLPTPAVELAPGETALIPLGFKATLPAGYEAQIRPRSGMAFTRPLVIPNAPGTIDEDYPDEWKVMMRNDGDVPQSIAHGERIAQMVIAQYAVLSLEIGVVGVATTRTGGFGSTGER